MHSAGFGDTLEQYASQVPLHQAIVEVGSWVGASAYHLAKASGPQPLHLYDKWMANQSEADKLYVRGVPGVKIGQDLLPMCEGNLSEFGDRIHYHKGNIHTSEYNGPQIGLYVDDASKNSLFKVLPVFHRHFAPGCIVLLMDFYWPPCEKQREYVESLRDTAGWELLGRDKHDKNCSIWECP